MTQTIGQLTARIAELEAENRIERNLRIGVEAAFDMLNEEIGRYKAAFEQQKEEIQRWKYSAENPNFEGRFDTWQSVAGKYRAEAEELKEENARLNLLFVKAAKGKGENLKECFSLQQQLAASQAYAEQLREALKLAQSIIGHPDDAISEYIAKTIDLPRDTSALDAYVAEKVKEATEKLHYRMEHCYSIDGMKAILDLDEMTRQRDLAVEAITRAIDMVGHPDNITYLQQTLDAIKESEK